MAHLVTRGLVLREVWYKDSDKILTVLLDGAGKRTVRARGCRRNNSPLSASAQLLVWSEMTLFDYRDRASLREAVTLREFRGVREDLAKFSLGSYFAEVGEAVAEEGVETPGLLALLLNSLYAMESLSRPLPLMKAAFELKLACLSGYMPVLDACAVCGRTAPENPRLSLREGVLHCADCPMDGGGVSLPLDGPSLDAMRYVVHGNPRRLFSFSLPAESLNRLSAACEGFLLHQLGRGFRTLDFYQRMTPEGSGISL